MIQIESTIFTALNDTMLNMTASLTRNQRDSLRQGILQLLKCASSMVFTSFKCGAQLSELATVIRRAQLEAITE